MITSLTGRRWVVRPGDDALAERLRAALGLLPAVARICAARGLGTSFFRPGSADLLDPAGMLGMGRAIDRIERAIADAEPIRLVTDYDVDGTTSCLILHSALDRRGAGQVSYHVPDRFTEGYGLSRVAVDRAAADGVRLLVTADIGVRDHATISHAKALGIDVLVCDHHLPAGESVPADAYAVLCPPQAGCAYPNKALAACGVSFKLASALLAADPRRDDMLASLLKLAAIGTVADVVDLRNAENRAIVTLGLRALNERTHAPGLQALLDVSRLSPGDIDAASLGWRIGPRINAAGRLKDANAVVRLLRERHPGEARAQAEALDALNRERQDVQERLLGVVLDTLPSAPPAFVVVAGTEEDGFHRGVVGIVAAKVRERINRPVAIVSVLGSVATGSVRSTPAVHATRALDAVAPLLLRYGGHAAAAGFTVPTDKLQELADRLATFVDSHHDADDLVVTEEADDEVAGTAITLELARQLRALEPTGKGNPPARLVVDGPIEGVRVGGGKHLFFRVGGAEAVWWGAADRADLLARAERVLGEVEIERWNGREKARVKVEDVA